MLDEMLTSNSPPAIQQRIQAGHIGWAGPSVLTTARTALILLVQLELSWRKHTCQKASRRFRATKAAASNSAMR
jgi:hypothetical protein